MPGGAGPSSHAVGRPGTGMKGWRPSGGPVPGYRERAVSGIIAPDSSTRVPHGVGWRTA